MLKDSLNLFNHTAIILLSPAPNGAHSLTDLDTVSTDNKLQTARCCSLNADIILGHVHNLKLMELPTIFIASKQRIAYLQRNS